MASDLLIKTTYKIGDGGLGRNRYNHSGIHHLIRVVRVVQRHNLIGRNASNKQAQAPSFSQLSRPFREFRRDLSTESCSYAPAPTVLTAHRLQREA